MSAIARTSTTRNLPGAGSEKKGRNDKKYTHSSSLSDVCFTVSLLYERIPVTKETFTDPAPPKMVTHPALPGRGVEVGCNALGDPTPPPRRFQPRAAADHDRDKPPTHANPLSYQSGIEGSGDGPGPNAERCGDPTATGGIITVDRRILDERRLSRPSRIEIDRPAVSWSAPARTTKWEAYAVNRRAAPAWKSLTPKME